MTNQADASAGPAQGKMRGLTAEEIKEFLAGPIVARLATVKPDGSPYVVPIWQYYDGTALYFVARRRAQYVEHIRSDPRVCVSCALDAGPGTRVIFEGKAEIVEGPAIMAGRMLTIARDMATRYGGDDGNAYLDETLDRPRFLIRFEPEKTTSWEGGEWAPKYLK